MITRILNQLFYFYYILLILRIFLTWIPSIDWQQQPFLNIFRGIIPPIGGMLDISPVIAIILLQLVQGLLVGMLSGLGL